MLRERRAAISAARAASIRTGLDERDPASLEAETGLIVLAMGKYGAFELNYSSDIDLVVFYDANAFLSQERRSRAARPSTSSRAWSSC
jgi:glutamine synthetase adenylyltransferase